MSATPNQIHFCIEDRPFHALLCGQGSYNIVYSFWMDDRHLILKIQKSQRMSNDMHLSNPRRAVRVMGEVSPDLNPREVTVTFPGKAACVLWIADFQEQYLAPLRSAEIAAAVLAEYQKPGGRVIYDADVLGNFMAVAGPRDPVTGRPTRKVLCLDVDQALRRGSVASERFAQMQMGGSSIKKFPGVISTVVSMLFEEEFNFERPPLNEDEKRALIQKAAAAAMNEVFQRIYRLDVDSVARGTPEQKACMDDFKLFLPFVSIDHLVRLADQYLREREDGGKFELFMKSLPESGENSQECLKVEWINRSIRERSSPDEISRNLMRLLVLLSHGVEIELTSIQDAAVALSSLCAVEDPEKFRIYLENHLAMLLRRGLRRSALTLPEVLTALMPGEGPEIAQAREDILFVVSLNLLAKKHSRDLSVQEAQMRQIHQMMMGTEVSQAVKARVLSESEALKGYIEENLDQLTDGLSTRAARERLTQYGFSAEQTERLLWVRFTRQLGRKFDDLERELCVNMRKEKDALIRRLLVSGQEKLSGVYTPEALATLIYQLERVVSHKSFGFRRFGSYSTDFKRSEAKFLEIRRFYEDMFPGLPLISQQNILKPQKIDPALNVLTFKAMLAQDKAGETLVSRRLSGLHDRGEEGDVELNQLNQRVRREPGGQI
jgi:hypothetical protein